MTQSNNPFSDGSREDEEYFAALAAERRSGRSADEVIKLMQGYLTASIDVLRCDIKRLRGDERRVTLASARIEWCEAMAAWIERNV